MVERTRRNSDGRAVLAAVLALGVIAAGAPPGSIPRAPEGVVRVPTLGLVQTPEPPQGLALIALDIELGCKVYTRRASRSEGIHMARSPVRRDPPQPGRNPVSP